MDSAVPPSSPRKYISLGIRLAVGFGLLAFLFMRHADLQQVWKLIAGSSGSHLLFALFIAISGEVITAYKWRLLVSHIGGNLPILTAVKASFIGMFYNNLFPGSVGGDIARVLLIARHAGGKARATASAFMQRNTGLAGLFAIGIPAAYIWPRHLDLPTKSALNLPEWMLDVRTWLVGAAIGYAAINTILFSQLAYHRLWSLVRFERSHPAPSRIHHFFNTFMRKLQRFHTELHGYHFWLPLPLVISAFTQLVDICLVYTLAQALGLNVPFHVLLVAVPVVTLANLAPVTVNGIGLREAVYVALLHSAGVSANQAVALSLLHFATITMLAAMGGLLHAFAPAKQL